jgi:hypothetical protein
MSSHILPSQSFKSARPIGFGKALGHLALATARLTEALLASNCATSPPPTSAPTPVSPPT